eukprot:m.155061 g.155061  ORF g.155061 m.155061 type:complete len:529 (-) comp17926_c0_seq1:74-1660(-)
MQAPATNVPLVSPSTTAIKPAVITNDNVVEEDESEAVAEQNDLIIEEPQPARIEEPNENSDLDRPTLSEGIVAVKTDNSNSSPAPEIKKAIDDNQTAAIISTQPAAAAEDNIVTTPETNHASTHSTWCFCFRRSNTTKEVTERDAQNPEQQTTKKKKFSLVAAFFSPTEDKHNDGGLDIVESPETRKPTRWQKPDKHSSASPHKNVTALRRRTMSVAALGNDEQVVVLDSAEIDEIRTVYEEVFGAFTMHELGRLYADYKLNGKEITKSDFGMIFDTFSRKDVGMADLLFGMFDAEHSGTLSFDALVKALAIMIKGSREDKIELCFRLLDTDMDGEIHRSGIINLMGFLPMSRMKRESDAMRGYSGPECLRRMSQVVEEDEDEETEKILDQERERKRALEYAAFKRKQDNDIKADILDAFKSCEEMKEEEDTFDSEGLMPPRSPSVRPSSVISVSSSAGAKFTRSSGGTTASSRRKETKEYTENVAIATGVVDEALAMLGKDSEASISLEEFAVLCDNTEISTYLLPM